MSSTTSTTPGRPSAPGAATSRPAIPGPNRRTPTVGSVSANTAVATGAGVAAGSAGPGAGVPRMASHVPGPEAVAALAARVCPGFTAGAVLRRTPRSLLLSGSVGRGPVVVKFLTDPSPHWLQRFRHEVNAYRTFTRQRPPVRVPRLIAADPERRILVMEHVAGRPAANERHPSTAMARADVRAILHTFATLNRWKPPPGSFPLAFDYPARVDRYHKLGLLTDRDAGDLAQLLRGLSRVPAQFCHGDAVLSNVLLTAQGAALVDWESSGYHLPGYDLAVLWTLLARDPMTRRQIIQTAQQSGSLARDAFLVNLMLVLVREIRLNDVGTVGEEQRRLLRRLHDDCGMVRRAVRAAIGTR
ncbi:aminoglycoside phosphotransferase family protein [Embleya sp. NBC_00896]|uniref:aminoglycoside phosphotransferase family protein n=1 Tax=Embleya sp. NBC_00896 TaxID=2975961 RepID=UPI003864E384